MAENITGKDIPEGKEIIAYWIKTGKTVTTNQGGGPDNPRPKMPFVKDGGVVKKVISPGSFYDYILIWPRTR